MCYFKSLLYRKAFAFLAAFVFCFQQKIRCKHICLTFILRYAKIRVAAEVDGVHALESALESAKKAKQMLFEKLADRSIDRESFKVKKQEYDDEIAAKGNMSWTEYRIKLMTDAGRELVVNPAKAVNPQVKVIIKYPNWYDHFHGSGFNLEEEPTYFDGLWTGTETRDPASDQHLQNYLSYNIIRYFDNIAPGKNGGGWVDAGGIHMSMDRYAEQVHLTMLARTPEIILWNYMQLATVKITPAFPYGCCFF